MEIPKDLLKKWEVLRSHGDNKKISEINEGIIEMDVSRAFSKGECSEEAFKAIAGFYKERAKLVRQYVK